MLFDGPTFLLIFLALLGRQRRATVARRALGAWKRSASGLIVAGLILATLGPFEWLVMAALACVELGVLVGYLGGHRALKAPRAKVALRLAIALLLHLLFVGLAPNVRLEAGHGATPLWFVDLVARGWSALIVPMLTLIVPGVNAQDVLAVLTPGLAFMGASLVALQFVWSYLALGLIWRVVARDAIESEVHRPLDGLGLGTVALFVLALLLAQGPEAAFGVKLLSGALTALFAVHGLYWLSALAYPRLRKGWGLPLAAGFAVVLFAHPELWRALCGLGLLEILWRRGRPEIESVRMLSETISRQLGRALGPLVLLGFALPALVVGGGVTQLIAGEPLATLSIPPAAEGAHPSQQPLRLPTLDGGLLQIDRYELPNRRDTLPTVGLTPQDAALACEARGARLCTTDELGLVCSSGKGERFLGGGTQGFFSGETVWRLQSDCNFGRVDDDAVRRLQPSGESDACRGDWAVYDLVGNANEWAVISDKPGFFGLVGSDYRYDDLRLLTCGAHVLVPVSFVDHLDLQAVGARCCR